MKHAWLDSEGLHGLSPTELDESYLRVHRHLLGMMRREMVSHMVKCRKCTEPAFWRDVQAGPYPHTDFYCDKHGPAGMEEINKTARAILKALEGI